MTTPQASLLTVTHPEYADQLVNPPGQLRATSGRKVTWQCTGGHTWDERVVNRVNRGGGCLICEGIQLRPGLNDLAATHPHLAAEAEGWDPKTTPWGSTRKRRWRCLECRHRYVTSPAARVAGEDCPTCSHGGDPTSITVAGRRPDIAAQAHGWNPSTVTVGERTPQQWKCHHGHTWEAKISDRIHYGSGCPTCAGKIVQPGFNDLATTYPELAAEADGWDPTTVSAGQSAKKLRWKCALGHTWETAPSLRTWAGGTHGCPICAGKTVQPGFNDLATTHPELAAEADGWDPTTVIAAQGKHLPWKCAQGHTWTATIPVRRATKGCPACAGKIVQPGFNDLATTHPDLAAQLTNLDPTKLDARSTAIGTWECPDGHIWQDVVQDRVGFGSDCPECLFE